MDIIDKEARRKELLKEAKKLARKIVEEYKPEKIILFGSAATGDIRKNSDIDLLVVKETNDHPIKRDQKVLRLLSPVRDPIPLDVVVFTPEELDYRSKGGDPFVLEALGGEVLYG